MPSRSLPYLLALLAAAVVLAAGCAVDPVEKLQDQLDSQQVSERALAVKQLTTLKDDRSVELLVQTLEGDPDLLEPAGNALVVRGRAWEALHPHAKKSEQNPVIEHVSATIADMHLDAAIRAKACWVLGEIGSRRALGALKGRTLDPNSMIVRTEATTALNKLGSGGDAAAREMLADGTLVQSYDPEKRGLVIKSEGGNKKKAGTEETGTKASGEEKPDKTKTGDQKAGEKPAGQGKAAPAKPGTTKPQGAAASKT